MKKIIYFLGVILLVGIAQAQNVGIGTTSPGSKLDVRGSTPDDGVVISVGNSNASHQLSFFGGRINDPNPFIIWKGGDPLRFATDANGFTEYMRINSYGRIGIGTAIPDTSAILELNSNNKGFLPPRMTTAQRNAIPVAAIGLIIFNTTTNTLEYDNGPSWVSIHNSQHFIGESYGGGTIFYLYDNGQHGLIAAFADQPYIKWSNGTNRLTGTKGDGLNAGVMNTTMIIATQIGDNQSGNFAAKACANYSISSGVGEPTYGDWYLPSEYELNLLFLQRSVVSGLDYTEAYWSSTEQDTNTAWTVNFGDGFQTTFSKEGYNLLVRPIRAF